VAVEWQSFNAKIICLSSPIKHIFPKIEDSPLFPLQESPNLIHCMCTMKKLLLTTFALITCAAPAKAMDFDSWLTQFKAHAAEKGISAGTINTALDGVQPIARIIELDRKQPEGTITFAQYRKNIVNPVRIKKGRELYRKHYALLKEIESKYGVAPQYVVALWGIETNFGGYTGGFDTVTALATLAHDGRRSEFFTKELINALTIIDEGHIPARKMQGSWAGALGQNQFMPSSFLSYAVDYNNDGKKDIWNSLPDVFASSSNYLARSGWSTGDRWGRAVTIPSNLDRDLISTKIEKPLSEWKKLGVTLPSGAPIPVADMQASLVQPDGPGTQSFLVYNNFKTILKWNRSTYFATSVGLLADAIAAGK
jgi:membrane-bound lytic murein transglycosylase B